jgi:hypothetical protein
MMDCNAARLLLTFAGPAARELDPAEAGAIEVHLESCPDCRALAASERRLDAHVGRAMRAVPVPASLHDRLLVRLGAERDAFYRRWLVRAAGIAALLMLTVGLGWYFLSRPAPLELESFREYVRLQNAPQRDAMDAWLKQVGGKHLSAPSRFHYALLCAHGLDRIQGQQVPYLFFVQSGPGGPVWARVYVLDQRRVDLEALREQALAGSAGDGFEVHVEQARDNDEVVYVIFYTGPSLDVFQDAPRQVIIRAAAPEL